MLSAYREWEVCGEATDGEDAIQKAMELQPDVVIMDLSMPGLSGLRATQRIREALPQIEVLMLTMHESREMLRAAREAGALGYLVKSETDIHLFKAMRAACCQEPYFPAD